MSSRDTSARTAEFARLFNFFESLASREMRKRVASASLDEDTLTLPQGITPVLRNLAEILGTPSPSKPAAIRTRPRSATDASATRSTIERFPVGKDFPFTFKLMLHKLYDREDWADKVKQALEASQEQFKPLSEKSSNVPEKVEGSDAPVKRTKPGLRHVRTRSCSVVVSGKARENAIGSPPMSPRLHQDGTARAVKKRCVGRRKSIEGLTLMAGQTSKAQWIYEGEVSSVADDGPEKTIDWPATAFASPVLAPRARHQSLVEGHRAREAATKRVKFAAIDELGVAETTRFPPKQPRRSSTNVTETAVRPGEGTIAKRSATTVPELPGLPRRKRSLALNLKVARRRGLRDYRLSFPFDQF